MTCRGLLEFTVHQAFVEVRTRKNSLNLKFTDRFRNQLDSLGRALPPQAGERNFHALHEAFIRCTNSTTFEVFYGNFYSELSKEIHGASWSGPSVLRTPLAEGFRCAIEIIATHAGLDFED
eukprot:CAMPEP_0184502974 /NCGR_PEP_ID=MMETSP0113_2-20130426/51598_1 /TAXON_ID=91329 /ORGANISM="Norrisiella sphaerica, Strain BC52" /LENGTH=120 /DNA_ID=CAMNT_0026892351 /DNA_START=1046 /DNA_END=1408 /DNA_ORIENTATION=+